jgi:hypothetical protein
MDKNTSVCKTVKSRQEMYVEFTDEEMGTLGIAPGDKFELVVNEEDPPSITLKKMVPLDIDLEEFDKSTLIGLIDMSVRRQLPCDDIIRESLASLVAERLNR